MLVASSFSRIVTSISDGEGTGFESKREESEVWE